VLTPPADLTEQKLLGALRAGWDIAVDSVDYVALGWGSHHWAARGSGDTRWFVTVDELDLRRVGTDEPVAAAFDRLAAALTTARVLHESGATWVVAPLRARSGEALVFLEPRFSVAVFPYVDGERYSWGDFETPEHRCGVLDLVVALHTAPAAARAPARADDFVVPSRDAVEAAAAGGGLPDCGPYAERTAALLAEHADQVHRLLSRYDGLVAATRSGPDRTVLTHGEPHRANTIRTTAGWVLIDWDTVLLAPPERDLWSLDPGDGSVLAAYARATGTQPAREVLDLYRVRWDVNDLAAYVARFSSAHADTPDDVESWEQLVSLMARLPY
jgi:spectinomycin phosphotransferase/16S rRNA (guanine(1405)-N(7))-methyltransferase